MLNCFWYSLISLNTATASQMEPLIISHPCRNLAWLHESSDSPLLPSGSSTSPASRPTLFACAQGSAADYAGSHCWEYCSLFSGSYPRACPSFDWVRWFAWRTFNFQVFPVPAFAFFPQPADQATVFVYSWRILYGHHILHVEFSTEVFSFELPASWALNIASFSGEITEVSLFCTLHGSYKIITRKLLLYIYINT